MFSSREEVGDVRSMLLRLRRVLQEVKNYLFLKILRRAGHFTLKRLKFFSFSFSKCFVLLQMPWELFALFWSCQLLLICDTLLYKMLPQLLNQIWFSFGNWPQALRWVICCAMLCCAIWFEDKKKGASWGQRGFKIELRLNALCAGLAWTRWGWLGATMCTHNMSTICDLRLRCCDASYASLVWLCVRDVDIYAKPSG